MAGPSTSLLSGDKMALRRSAREHRRTYVEGLSDVERTRQEEALAKVLEPLLAASRVTGGYHPIGHEISPLPALSLAAANHVTVAFPAFADHQSHLRFLAGQALETGPWAVMQPALSSPEVFPDLILIPLVAIDRKGVRLGQGKGHYDRVLAEHRRRGSLLIGLGWPVQMLDRVIPDDPWDVPLDGFASPEGLERFR